MMSRYDASTLTEQQHIEQSLEDIATTPIGSRTHRREYGTSLADLIDHPLNEVLVLKCYSTLYSAFTRWEDRIEINQIQAVEIGKGNLMMDISAIYLSTGNPMSFKVPFYLGSIA
ncbi:GPW/gp25 family protein [Acinetobacter guillouiae]|uniref:GPW/gp25 family protein n=1 Tax=Acinetobacter guillouiae TaxID=106649 RepID=UPI00125FE4A9|nr:GPW/gp25 family protein [Acinetobacter guillouiae]